MLSHIVVLDFMLMKFRENFIIGKLFINFLVGVSLKATVKGFVDMNELENYKLIE